MQSSRCFQATALNELVNVLQKRKAEVERQVGSVDGFVSHCLIPTDGPAFQSLSMRTRSEFAKPAGRAGLDRKERRQRWWTGPDRLRRHRHHANALTEAHHRELPSAAKERRSLFRLGATSVPERFYLK